MKRFIKLSTLIILFSMLINIDALSFGNSIYSGSGEALTIPTDITSWHPASGPYGIRVTLVNSSNGLRVGNTVSVDYSDFEGLENFAYFSTIKKSKLDYITMATSNISSSSLIIPTSSTNQYQYKLLKNTTLPKLLTAARSQTNTNMFNYFKANYSPSADKTNFIQLLTDLKVSTSFINDVKNASNINNVLNSYNYSLVVEPVLYFALRSDNFYGSKNQYATYIAATATEAALYLNDVNETGNIRTISHLQLPTSLFVTSTVFPGSSLQIEPVSATIYNSTKPLNSGQIYTKTGLGMSVIKLIDIVGSYSPTNTYALNNNSTNGYAMSVVENGTTAMAGLQNTYCNANGVNYCNISCNESMNANFPSNSYKLKAGTHFVFEPIEMTGTRTCNATIDVARARTNYDSKAIEVRNAYSNMLSSYDAWKDAEAKYLTWVQLQNNKFKCTNVVVDGRTTYICPTANGTCQIGTKTTSSTRTYNPNFVGCDSTSFYGKYNYLNYQGMLSSSCYYSGSYKLVSSGHPYNILGKVCEFSASGTSIGGKSCGGRITVDNVGCCGVSLPRDRYWYYNGSGKSWLPPSSMKVNTGLIERYDQPITVCKNFPFVAQELTTSRDGQTSNTYCEKSGNSETCTTNINGSSCKEVTNSKVPVYGNKYNWYYVYVNSSGSSIRVNMGPDCQNASYADERNAKKSTYDYWVNQYNTTKTELSRIETVLYNADNWINDVSTGFTNSAGIENNAELIVTTNDASGTNTYNNFVIDKNYTESINTTSYSSNIPTYNDYGQLDGGSVTNLYTSMSKVMIVHRKYNLASNTNRYILKDTGAVVSSLPSKYTSGGSLSGYYSDIGYPNYKVGVSAIGNGTITISYRNLGSTSYKLDKTLADSVPLAGFVNGRYFTYTSTYTVEGGIIDPNTKNINLVYRQIDLTNPFPYHANTETTTERQPGFNWRINTSSVSDVITAPGKDVYNKQPMYVIDFTGNKKSYIQTIRRYNNTNNYEYAMKCNGVDAYGNNNGTECRSTYLSTLKSAGVVSGCGIDVTWNSCGR